MAETVIEALNDAEGERLLQLGQEVDSGRQDADSATSAEQPEPRATGEGEQKAPLIETDEGKTQPDSPELGPETEKPEEKEETEQETQEELKPAAKKGTEQPETEYSKAKKDQERLGKSWQALQAEKEAVRAREAALQEAEQYRQLQSQAQMPVITKDGFSRVDYEKAAENFRQNGDYENEAKALRVVMEIGAVEAQEVQKRQIAATQYQFQTEMNQLMQQDEELRTADSPLAQTVMQLLDQHPYLEAFPNGFQRTVDLARLILEARSASELREEYERLRAELENRDRKSQPLKGGPTVPSSTPTDWDSMTQEQKDAHMERMTREADRMYGT